MRAKRHGGTTGHAESRATGSASPLMPCHARGLSVFLGVQVVRRRSESRSGTPVGTSVVGSRASGQVAAAGASPRLPPAVGGPSIGAPYSALGQATAHWGAPYSGIGAGYGALGQVINLPQWGLTCPSRCFPAPMHVRAPPDDVGPPEAGQFPAPVLPHFIESLAEALLQGTITLKDTGNGARRARRRARSRAHADPEDTKKPAGSVRTDSRAHGATRRPWPCSTSTNMGRAGDKRATRRPVHAQQRRARGPDPGPARAPSRASGARCPFLAAALLSRYSFLAASRLPRRTFSTVLPWPKSSSLNPKK